MSSLEEYIKWLGRFSFDELPTQALSAVWKQLLHETGNNT